MSKWEILKLVFSLVSRLLGLILMFQALYVSGIYHDYARASYLAIFACIMLLPSEGK